MNLDNGSTFDVSPVNNGMVSYVMVLGMTSLVLVPNIIVLYLLIRSSQLRKNQRTEFILWLCISDILVGFSGFLIILRMTMDQLKTNVPFCNAILHFIGAGILQSIAHTFLVCVERYIAVAKAARFKLFTKKYRYYLIIGTWTVVHIHVGSMVGCFLRADQIVNCSLQEFPEHKTFQVAMSVGCLPLLFLTTAVYACVMKVFRQQQRKVNIGANMAVSTLSQQIQPPSSTNSTTQQRRLVKQTKERHVLITIGLIVLALLFLTGAYFWKELLYSPWNVESED